MKKIYHSIILARGGSKGIKNKNLKKVKSKPLLYWSITKSLKSNKINYTWVISDLEKILNYSKKNGALTIKRPKNLARDKSTSESAWIHAIKEIENKGFNIDNVVGIQPTSPIRSSKDFDNAIKVFENKNLDSLFTSTIFSDFFIWKKNKNGTFKPNYNYKKRKTRQEITKHFLENGSFFIFKKNKFINYKCRFFGKIGTYVMSKPKSFQIDEKDDLAIINLLAEKYL